MDKNRRKNQLIVTAFLFIVIGFTAALTFFAGPRMMKLRKEVRNKQLLYKCQHIVSGDTIVVQLRSEDRPNPNPLIQVSLAGISAPPFKAEQSPETIAWAQGNGFTPADSAKMGKSSRNALASFLRKQNLTLKNPDGSDVVPPDGTNLVAHAFMTGSEVGNKQLQNGLALHKTEAEQAFFEIYSKTSETAKSRNKGLWNR